MKGKKICFTLKTVHPDHILKIISGLKNSKAVGLDNINTFILKLVKHELTPAITHIINLSIQQSTFPSGWKYAKVIPLFKSGDHLDPKNFRPVALLPIASKILERVVFIQIVEYMDQNKLFHPNHHAYRSLHSTTTAMLQMYDTWVEALERGELAGVVMVDQSAAFDVVDHSLLRDKLELYKWDKKTLDWMSSYLKDRQQSCYVEGFLSPPLPVQDGLPQGSNLAPLMFNIYTNDFPDTIHEDDCPLVQPEIEDDIQSSEDDIQSGEDDNLPCGEDDIQSDEDGKRLTTINKECNSCGELVIFADDSTYCVSAKDPQELSVKLSHKLSVMADYLTANKLKVNSDKTHLLVMSTDQFRRRNNFQVQIYTPLKVIVQSSVERLLGLYVHEGMKFREYILDNDQSLLSSLNRRLAGLKKVSLSSSSFKNRLIIANGVFMSKLIYMIPVWSGCDEHWLDSMQVAQNAAARLVTKCGKRTDVRDLLRQVGWLSVRQLGVYHSVIQIHNTLQYQYPEYLYRKLTNDGDYPYNTRQSKSSTIRRGPSFKSKLTLSQKSWRWRASQMYEKLPIALRRESKPDIFKRELKKWVSANIPL